MSTIGADLLSDGNATITALGGALKRSAKHLLVLCHLGLIFGWSSWLTAESGAKTNYSQIDGGLWVTNLKGRSSAPSGYADKASHLLGLLRYRRAFNLGKSFHFEPSLAVALPWIGSYDGSAKTFLGFLGLDLSVRPLSFLGFRMGPGMHWQSTVAKTEAVTLNNGEGTSDFYMPGGWSNSFLLSTNGALSIFFSQKVSLQFEVSVTAVADAKRRRYNGFAGVGVIL